MDKTIIKPFEEQNIKVYAYMLPDVSNHDGCIKVGETTREVEKRIKEQLSTAGLIPKILFHRTAKKCNGEWFHDKDLHKYFILNKIERVDFGTGADEWFYFNGTPEKAEILTDKYIAMDYDEVEIEEGKFDYVLRSEQKLAVERTYVYYNNPIYGTEFLWNAKPRFGKTLTTYDFIRKLNATNVLIVTNRPAIANSWADDFKNFISWQEPRLKFISDSDSLKGKVMTRENYLEFIDSTNIYNPGCIAFVSLQDMKGAKTFGGEFEKLQWVASLDWDLLVIDEAHEGVDTFKTDKAFSKIQRKFTLHLSGTPFKAIANNKFHEEQIYNWSYLDEQIAKKTWDDSIGTNPYENLPVMSLFTYKMSDIISKKVSHGLNLSEENNVDYAFDLNEFFKTKEDGKFFYEQSVLNFLDNLSEGKFPFAKTEYRNQLSHTFWLLPRVSSVKAMEKLLKNHNEFKKYEIILAAGDGISLDSYDDNGEKLLDTVQSEKSYDKVKKAIQKHNKTITLSVGQLTTGVTIPEWTGVFMLRNIESPSLYFQAAFRSQNPYEFKDEKTGKLFRKENAYIFDFAPDRTLRLFDEFANNLIANNSQNTIETRKQNIKELINFFPVIAEDSSGMMHELDADEVLTIPNKIKSEEVVKRGFMSNLLFANISAIFSAPAELKEILDKIIPEKNKRHTTNKEITVTDPLINENGNIDIPTDIVINTTKNLFGNAIYKEGKSENPFGDIIQENDSIDNETSKITDEIISNLSKGFTTLKTEFDLNKNQINKVKIDLEKSIQSNIKTEIEKHKSELETITKKYSDEISNAKTIEEKHEKEEQLYEEKLNIQNEFNRKIEETVKVIVEDTVQNQIVKKEEEKKKSTEDQVRDHLRGFARTIPAFLMAYGDEETTLGNFDKKVDEKTFEELTSITLDEFRSLRDGLIYTDEEGNEKQVPGLFDEIVFNSSIKEFLLLKNKLSDYISMKEKEDIFDYIPPQKTNQIFTPREVVRLMIEPIERKDPKIFSNKNATFIDLYSKSGLYITEIVKKLNIGLSKEIPEYKDRIKWILENQVYACCPSNIIYNMVKNYVYDGYDYVNHKNIIQLDLTNAAENGKIFNELNDRWGDKMKFDVVIGNPPYQETDGGAQASAKPIYQYFVKGAKELSPRYICLITPSRWYVGGKGLDEFRDEMLNDLHLEEIHDWLTPNDIFPNTNIRGGVSYFLWNSEYDNREDLLRVVTHKDNKIISDMKRPLKIEGINIFVRDNISVKILDKINYDNNLSLYVSSRKPYGLATNFIESTDYHESKDKLINPILCYSRGWNKGYVERSFVNSSKESIDRFKIFASRANNVGTELPDDNLNIKIGLPGEICTESYLIIGSELNLDSKTISNLETYLKTKFLRYLHSLSKGSQDATSRTYRFIPLQDFTDKSDIDWSKDVNDIDKQLFAKYNLSDDEINHIVQSIKDMK